MTVDDKADLIQIVCLFIAFLSACALVLMRNPGSFLSRWIDEWDARAEENQP